jgi:hypothetical protein
VFKPARFLVERFRVIDPEFPASGEKTVDDKEENEGQIVSHDCIGFLLRPRFPMDLIPGLSLKAWRIIAKHGGEKE